MFLGHVVLTQAGISPQPAVFWELLGRGRGPSGGLQVFPAIGSPPHEGIPRASPGAVPAAGRGWQDLVARMDAIRPGDTRPVPGPSPRVPEGGVRSSVMGRVGANHPP